MKVLKIPIIGNIIMGLLWQLSRFEDFWQKAIKLLIFGFVMLFSLSFHEFSHGLVANFLGDSTAKNRGRLTLNPLKHLNLMGTIFMFFFGFGWANPVPVDIRNFAHQKRDMALVAIFGPISNLILVFLGFILLKIYGMVFMFYSNKIFWYYFNHMLTVLIMLNISLAVFNLIPIPPLDGSRIITAFLPNRLYFFIMRFEMFGSFLIMFLLYKGNLKSILFKGVLIVLNFFRMLFKIQI